MRSLIRGALAVGKWLLIGGLGLIIVVVIAGNLYGVIGRNELKRNYEPPGRMVDVGTHKMYMHCVGTGRPTVVLDAGVGGFSLVWASVMEEAREITRVCAFDRSGLGWSEAGPNPPTPQWRLREFEQLLMASGEQAPFIFAGHSQGAQLAWLHTQNHLDQAAGLITVDSTPRGILEIEAIGRSSKPSATQSLLYRAIDSLGLKPVVFKAMTLAQPTTIEEDSRQAPEWAREAAKRVPFIPQEGFIDAILHWNDYAHAAREMAHLGNLPLIVIAKGQDGILFNAWGDRASEANEMWRTMQIELASMSSDAEFIIAESSGHEIPVRQPSVVVDAIRTLVQKYSDAESD